MSKHIVAITACAAGIAHTYMAAESLEQAGKKRGDSVRVETQGSIGAENILTEQEIREADVVIVAADIDIDLARFAGKRVLKVRSVDAIKDANALIERALNEATLYGEKGSKAGSITLGKTDHQTYYERYLLHGSNVYRGRSAVGNRQCLCLSEG